MSLSYNRIRLVIIAWQLVAPVTSRQRNRTKQQRMRYHPPSAFVLAALALVIPKGEPAQEATPLSGYSGLLPRYGTSMKFSCSMNRCTNSYSHVGRSLSHLQDKTNYLLVHVLCFLVVLVNYASATFNARLGIYMSYTTVWFAMVEFLGYLGPRHHGHTIAKES